MFNLSLKKRSSQWCAQLLTVACLVAPAVSQAKLSDFTVVTWNMQGANQGSENKWQAHVRQLVDSRLGGADILLLQEAGQVPPSAQVTSRVIRSQVAGIPVEEFTWQLGTRSRPQQVYIYFSRVDVGANRVNLAIVSRRMADDVIVIAPPTVASRPVLGIRLGTDAFFTTHALSGGGPDAGAVVRNVNQFFQAQTGPTRQTDWMIAGDFNRSPTQLQTQLQAMQPPLNFATVSSGQPTQNSGGELDYAVIGNATQSVTRNQTAVPFLAQRMGQLASDHVPVAFVSSK